MTVDPLAPDAFVIMLSAHGSFRFAADDGEEAAIGAAEEKVLHL